MSTIDDFIFNRLSTNVPVSGLVGGRIYPIKMPDDPTLPAITYQLVSGIPDLSTDGTVTLYSDLYAFDCWSRTATQVKDLAEKVRTALIGYRGVFNNVTVSGVTEWSSVELYEFDTEIYHISCNAKLWYSTS